MQSIHYILPYSFTYKANDGQLDSPTNATVSITVTPVNNASVSSEDSYDVNEDTTLTVSAPGVLGNDTDTDGDSLSAELVSGPEHGTLTLNPDGSFTYTPTNNYTGTDTFTYQSNDGTTNSAPVTVVITVHAVNDAPLVVNDSYTTPEDTQLTV